MLVKSKVKYIQSLSHKKQREADRVFIAEGSKIINELLNDPAIEPVELFALPDWINGHSQHSACMVTEIDEIFLSRISALSTPNQVLGIFRMPNMSAFDPVGKITLMLDGIQDPGNLGTIVRCADWFGIKNIMCSDDCVDVFNPKTIQSTMGSIARVSVDYSDLGKILNDYPQVPAFATTLDGDDVYKLGRISEGIILIGNESKGIRNDLLKLVKQKITITRKGKAESLNAAVATGIILHSIAG